MIDGEYLSHLRFADDILIFANIPHELQHMLPALAYQIGKQGLNMNKSKTKVMMENDTPIYVNNSFVYMGHSYSTREKGQDKEIQTRITAGWTAFARHRNILKRQIYNSCVLPVMTYGAETRALTTKAKNKLAAAQTMMEKSMLNIKYRDRKTNTW